MRIVPWSFAGAVLIVAIGCSEDAFVRNEPRLEVEAYTEHQSYASYDDEEDLIDLGQVPVFATKWAIFQLINATQQPLQVTSVSVASSTGERWGPFKWVDTENVSNAEHPFATRGKEGAFSVPPFATFLLGVPYSPLIEGEHEAVIDVKSDAANADDNGIVQVHVLAKAVFTGEPDIEVEYTSYRGPSVEADCTDDDEDGTIDACRIPDSDALDFGNIGLGARGTARLILRNKAECTPFEGVDPCSLCGLRIAADPTRQDIGLGFKPGTNEQGLFSFAGSTATPFEVRQRNMDPDCNEDGELRLLIDFNAPDEAGDHSTVIVVESNDPNEPLIEIPVKAAARNAPVAIAKLRAADPENPSAPYTEADNIEPLERVYLDGRDSYDPREPDNPDRISAYRWEVVEYPVGADPETFDHQGESSSLYSFWLPLAGHYVVRLIVTNNEGIESGDTPDSRVEFDVVPGSRLHVQLVWDNATNDQDLHFTMVTQDDRVCTDNWDCHWRNCFEGARLPQPIWFADFAAGDGPNPRLDIDDTQGLGPENTNIDDPAAGVYRIFVHYFGDHTGAGPMPTRATIRIYLNGLQVAEYRRTLSSEKAIWAVADVTWLDDGTGFVTPYPSDEAGVIGAVSVMYNCMSPGWAFQ